MDDLSINSQLQLMCICSSIIAIVTAIFVAIYRFARPHFPVIVNCWFCNQDSKVPYGNRSCWDCPFCEQYNGFTEDGDYNKAIPAQYKEALNHPVSIENRLQSSFKTDSPNLCEVCNRHQLLKIRQLANFVPYNENNYDMEVEGYKYHLEQIYRLCQPCQLTVDRVVEKQKKSMPQNLRDRTFPTPDSSFSFTESKTLACDSHLLCKLSTPIHVRLLRWCSLLCAFSLFLTALVNLLEHSALEPVHWFPRTVMIYCTALHKGITMVILLGLSTGLVAIYRFGKHSLHMCDAIGSLSWLLCLAMHSKSVVKQMTTEDMFLLQGICATANMVICLWGTFCPRFEQTSRSKSKGRRKKRYLNLSGSSMSSNTSQLMSDTSQGNTPTKQNSHYSEHNQRTKNVSSTEPPLAAGEACIDDRFETMSIGTPSRSGSNSPGVFSMNNQDHPRLASDQTSSTSAKLPNLQSLRHRRAIISPARFNPRYDSSSSKKLESATSKRKNMYAAMPTQNNLDRTQRWQQLTKPTVQDQDQEDRESLFSIPRTNKPDTSDSDDDGNNDSSSCESTRTSVCPVGTSGQLEEEDGELNCSVSDTKKRSICTRIFIGVSLGLNLALVLYFTVDFNNVSAQLDNLKDNVESFYQKLTFQHTSNSTSGSGANSTISSIHSAIMCFSQTVYLYAGNVLASLTQDLPGEGETISESV